MTGRHCESVIRFGIQNSNIFTSSQTLPRDDESNLNLGTFDAKGRRINERSDPPKNKYRILWSVSYTLLRIAELTNKKSTVLQLTESELTCAASDAQRAASTKQSSTFGEYSINKRGSGRTSRPRPVRWDMDRNDMRKGNTNHFCTTKEL